MGTTVTTNLGLIKPDTDEKIKADLPVFDGWAVQNGANMDRLDGLFRASTGSYTVNLTADTVNPTLGAGGFTEGKWVRIWPRMVLVYFRVFFGGAGFATGTGEYRINLPFAMDAAYKASDGGGRLSAMGKCILRDNSAVLTSSVFPVLYVPIANVMSFGLSQGGMYQNTFPAEQNDRLSGYFMYPTSDA
jgi:hypothetical protein